MPPAKNRGGRCGIGNGAGKPNNFWVPCTTYTKAATILRMLKRYGDQRLIGYKYYGNKPFAFKTYPQAF